MKTLVKIVIICAMAVVGTLLYWDNFKKANPVTLSPDKNGITVDIAALPIFAKGLSSVGIEIDEIGHHSFSPDGKYFVFNAIKDGEENPTKTYLVTLATGEVVQLPGFLLRGFEDDRIIALFKNTDLVLYDPAQGESENIATDGNIFAGTLSPDGTKYVFNTLEGIRKYDRNSKKTEVISSSQYDGATAWLKDGKRMVGFKDNGKAAFEAGNGRELGIWDIDAKTFTPLATKKPIDDIIRNATWIIPESIARINTGWDDGSHDYLVDILTREVVDLGETSSALMGGMKDEPGLGLFALVSGYGDIDKTITARIYKGLNEVSSATLPGGYMRENVQIVDEHTLMYLRKHLSSTNTIDRVSVVLLDVKKSTETVLKELDLNVYNSLSYSSENKVWIVSSKNKFILGKL